MVSPIDHVVMNHQNQTQTNGIWGHVRYNKELFDGGEFGFVDVAVVTLMPWLPSYERYGGFTGEEAAPGIAAWARRCGERESVAKSLHPPEKVDEFIHFLRIHLMRRGLTNKKGKACLQLFILNDTTYVIGGEDSCVL
jgi:hypothetical protein